MDIMAHVISPQLNIWSHRIMYCWFSHDVTKIQTTKLSILLRFYFHDVLEQVKTNVRTSFRFKRFLGFALEYAFACRGIYMTAERAVI